MSFLSYVQTKNVNNGPCDGQFTVVKRTTFKIKNKIPQVGGHNSLLKSFLLGLLLDTRHATSDLGWTVAPGSEVRYKKRVYFDARRTNMCSMIFSFSNFPSKCKRMSIYIRRSSAVKFKIIHILIMMHSLVKSC